MGRLGVEDGLIKNIPYGCRNLAGGKIIIRHSGTHGNHIGKQHFPKQPVLKQDVTRRQKKQGCYKSPAHRLLQTGRTGSFFQLPVISHRKDNNSQYQIGKDKETKVGKIRKQRIQEKEQIIPPALPSVNPAKQEYRKGNGRKCNPIGRE